MSSQKADSSYSRLHRRNQASGVEKPATEASHTTTTKTQPKDATQDENVDWKDTPTFSAPAASSSPSHSFSGTDSSSSSKSSSSPPTYASESIESTPKRSGFWKKVLMYGTGLLTASLVYYVVSEAKENPSWWYESDTKAPYVITPSGRKLAYNEYGNPLGTDVVLVFHDYLAGRMELEGLGVLDILNHRGKTQTPVDGVSAPSSASGIAPDSEKNYANVRLIVIDRPGYGQSMKQRHRRLSDWPEDVMRVVNALNIDKFSVIGIGAGGLYALACAATIPAANPGRLVNVAVVSSEAPRLDVFGMAIPTTERDQSREQMIQELLKGRSYWGSFLLKLSNVVLYSSATPTPVFEMLYGTEVKLMEARPELYKKMVLATREAWSQGYFAVKNDLAVTKDRSPTAAIGYSHILLAKGRTRGNVAWREGSARTSAHDHAFSETRPGRETSRLQRTRTPLLHLTQLERSSRLCHHTASWRIGGNQR